jgi:valyl-tRNA synthetase
MNEQQIAELIENNMNDVFACTRVWSAWSYNTMSLDDFLPFKEDDELIADFKEFLDKKSNVTVDDLVEFFENYEGYYNDDIENNFESHCFHDDYLEYCDMDTMANDINELKQIQKKTNRKRARP